MTSIVTGKPLNMGGSLGRVEATGRGVMLCTREAAKFLNIDLKTATASVQGFGNVGSVTAKLLQDLGVTFTHVSDVSGGIKNKKGIDINKLIDYVKKNKTIENYPDAQPCKPTDVLNAKVDILIPAALENQITEKNAHRIKCKILAEGANGPTTPEADKILFKNNVFVIPDILCNAGGVTVSYFEWVQNRAGYYWSEEEVNRRLEEKMVSAFEDVLKISLDHKADLRVGAFMLSIVRVMDVVQLRGIYA